jgi:hypothetical protein
MLINLLDYSQNHEVELCSGHMILHEIVWLLISTDLNKYLFGIIWSKTGTLMNLGSCLFCDCIGDEGRPTAGQMLIS